MVQRLRVQKDTVLRNSSIPVILLETWSIRSSRDVSVVCYLTTFGSIPDAVKTSRLFTNILP